MDVKNTNRYTKLAKTQKDTYPCMWTRGILPRELVLIRSAPTLEEQLFSHMMYCHADENQERYMNIDNARKEVFFQPGTYGTDASRGNVWQL